MEKRETNKFALLLSLVLANVVKDSFYDVIYPLCSAVISLNLVIILGG
jgi:hypothetical protein